MTTTTLQPATKGPALCRQSPWGKRSHKLKEVKAPLLDHLLAFITACNQPLIKSIYNEVVTAHTSCALHVTNCLRETHALITGNKRLHDGIADPSRDGGSTELFIGVVIPLWDKQPTSALSLDGLS